MSLCVRHLYRNALFSRLGVPFRFIALLQADVTDLKVPPPRLLLLLWL